MREQFTEHLLKELQTPNNVKRFSQLLRDTDICDLRDDNDFDAITKDGAPMLLTLLTYFNFGMLDKIAEIKRTIKE